MNHGQRTRAVVCIALAMALCIASVGQADHSKGPLITSHADGEVVELTGKEPRCPLGRGD